MALEPNGVCDERYSDGAERCSAAEPERADEGGGPGSGAAHCGLSSLRRHGQPLLPPSSSKSRSSFASSMGSW